MQINDSLQKQTMTTCIFFSLFFFMSREVKGQGHIEKSEGFFWGSASWYNIYLKKRPLQTQLNVSLRFSSVCTLHMTLIGKQQIRSPLLSFFFYSISSLCDTPHHQHDHTHTYRHTHTHNPALS